VDFYEENEFEDTVEKWNLLIRQIIYFANWKSMSQDFSGRRSI